MARSGDWITPRTYVQGDLVPFWGKPPTGILATAASYRALGISEFSARLASFLVAIVTVAATVLFAAGLWGKRVRHLVGNRLVHLGGGVGAFRGVRAGHVLGRQHQRRDDRLRPVRPADRLAAQGWGLAVYSRSGRRRVGQRSGRPGPGGTGRRTVALAERAMAASGRVAVDFGLALFLAVARRGTFSPSGPRPASSTTSCSTKTSSATWSTNTENL